MDGKRVPELPAFSAFTDALANDDKTILYLAQFDKTVWCDLATLRTYIATGGSGTITPVIVGNKHIHDVTEAEHGGVIVSLPQYAGKNFFLTRDGFPFDPTQYQILAGGGFKLTIPEDSLQFKQRFVLEFYELAVTGGGSGGSGVVAKLINGIVPVSINTTLSAINDVNKLVQVRGGSTATNLKVTLPKLEEVEENSLIIIETQINNTRQTEIATQDGQYIYMNNDGWRSLFMGLGETLWLYRGEDGYYVINEFGRIYTDLLKPHAAFRLGLNEVKFEGQEVNRLDDPRAWQIIETLAGSALVTEAEWQLAAVYHQGDTYTTSAPSTGTYETIEKPYRGCFSDGNGTTTFRYPDFRNMAIRGLKSSFGSDTERYHNKPGGFQKNALKKHDHYRNPQHQPEHDMRASSGNGTNGLVGGQSHHGVVALKTGISGEADESRMDNIGMFWVAKK